MIHYIDKSALVAEIEKLIDEIYAGRPFDSLSSEQQTALWYVKSIMSSINTIEVKEVDLENEIKEVQRHYKTIEEYEGYPAHIYATGIELIAKHFFELGLNAQKG